MTNRYLTVGLIAALTCGFLHANTNTFEHPLKAVCSTLLTKPLDPESIPELINYACNTSGLQQVRSRAMAVYALVALANADSNLFVSAKNSHAAKFPSDKNLIRVRLSDSFLSCAECAGLGFRDTPIACSLCTGGGKCMDTDCDRGRWIITQPGYGGPKRTPSVLPCPKCKGSGVCPKCHGQTSARTTCAACKGSGALFKRTPALFENYEELLRDMLAYLQTEEDFERAFHVATLIGDYDQRIAAFQKLIATFSRHPRIDDAVVLMNAAKEAVAKQASVRDEIEANRARELTTLKNLAASPKVACITIREYLEKNPTSPDRLELQGLLKKCEEEVKISEKREKLIYIVAGVLVALFGVSCINIHSYKYTLLPSYSPRDGAIRRKAGADPLTDPLSLSAKQSRSRVKTKTAQLPGPNE
jgi:hypothetical protein